MNRIEFPVLLKAVSSDAAFFFMFFVSKSLLGFLLLSLAAGLALLLWGGGPT